MRPNETERDKMRRNETQTCAIMVVSKVVEATAVEPLSLFLCPTEDDADVHLDRTNVGLLCFMLIV